MVALPGGEGAATAPVFVAIDLETTGLEPGEDRITEIGIVRFTLAGVERTYETLVNPQRPVSLRIQRLTGIDAASLRTAPHFNSVRLEIEDCLAGAIPVGHNVGFDLAFLAAAGLDLARPGLDTMPLARLLDPGRPDYRLTSLAAEYGIAAPVAHRALADAETARGVFLALLQRARALPDPVVRELLAVADPDWNPRPVLQLVAAERGFETLPLPSAPTERRRPLVPRPLAAATAAEAGEGMPAQPAGRAGAPSRPAVVSGIAEGDLVERSLAVLAAGRSHPERFGAFEERAEQIGMTRAVAQALADGADLLVEAGTGTGKSLAYLVPAALHGLGSGTRTIVSTNTLTLQEQLLHQDVPTLRALLAGVAGAEAAATLSVVAAKGRRNYLCLRRLEQARQQGPAGPADAALLARVLVWLHDTASGDRADLGVGMDEEPAWTRLSAEGVDCLSDRACAYVRAGTCFLWRARRRAEAAHVVVANHALLLSDAAAGGTALPAAETLIIDEAHHLEDAATQHLGLAITAGDFETLLDRLHRLTPAGRGAGIVATARGGGPNAAGTPALVAALAAAPALVEAGRAAVRSLFDALGGFVATHAENQFGRDAQLRITASQRAQPGWSAVEQTWEAAFAALRAVDGAASQLGEALARASAAADDVEVVDALASLAGDCAVFRQDLSALTDQTGRLLTVNDAERVTWISVRGRTGVVTLQAAPLRVAKILEAEVFARRRSVILTGATLCVENQFDHLHSQVGLVDAREERFGSPFDYRRAVRLLLPTDMPEPGQRGFARAVEETLLDLVLASAGRALVLFTSHGALQAAADGLRRPLEEAGIVVLAQGRDGSPARLISELAASERAVVLGTASLWEGVDVPGPAISLVVIARLPFAVPSDPVVAARSELYEDAFATYAVPQAVVRFRQGFGRLIRRRDDRGVVAVLDGRITSRGYGRAFVRSLPPVSVSELPSREFRAATAEWLAR